LKASAFELRNKKWERPLINGQHSTTCPTELVVYFSMSRQEHRREHRACTCDCGL